ncbi:glycosyltransferase [Lipingzhangella sp. LS1_29]|uniref:Glycosyltransferase n=1 Tax=Lipingzhangella rawalii TaxID=2055835 RepID=A0ABU2H3Y8_9ACTN|nr:glycosyltransferase [Lipingzhangella rawalii]MDS1269565.1 glycosyltransferase [Lipingzhangella rawalii]
MIPRLLRDATRVRGDDPALVAHIGLTTPPRLRRRHIRAYDRVVDLDRGGDVQSLDLEQASFVLLILASPTDLRRLVSLADRLPLAPHVLLAFTSVPAHWGPPLPAHPGQGQWNHLEDMQLRRHPGGAWSLEVFFLEPVATGSIVSGVARALGGARRHEAPNPLVALAAEPQQLAEATRWRPGDPGCRVSTYDGPVPTLRVTPAADMVLRHHRDATSDRPEWTDDRVRVVERVDPRSRAAASGVPVTELPPVDERTVNPVGFLRSPRTGTAPARMACLRRGQDGWAIVQAGRPLVRIPECGTVTDVDLTRLRQTRGVDIDWGVEPSPVTAPRAVAHLAAAGVPLVSTEVPVWASGLGDDLPPLLGSRSAAELRDDHLREEHSVLLRRAALRTHGSRAWWRRIGSGMGAPQPPQPTISVILCTRRPEMVEFALNQVCRQRRVTMEVLLTLHGFSAEQAGLAPVLAQARNRLQDHGHQLITTEAAGNQLYGQVLNTALERSSGALVAKMDDDDWYGPEHLADLLLAKDYSGADIAGSGQEYTYLEELDITVRRGTVTERAWQYVAGGAFLADRTVLTEVGGFRPLPRAIDTQLFTAVTKNGGRIYRTHGLGYVLRRKASGHTWSEGVGYFLTRTTGQWPGWRPSALLEPDPGDRPIPELTGAVR